MIAPQHPDAAMKVAALAHELWCLRQAAAGWRFGPSFDESLKTHDALVPFERLHPQDQAAAIAAVTADDLPGALASSIDHARGGGSGGVERGGGGELRVERMAVGVPVVLASSSHSTAAPPEIGRVESWETDASGLVLVTIKVRWPDGALTRHAAAERALRLAGRDPQASPPASPAQARADASGS